LEIFVFIFSSMLCICIFKKKRMKKKEKKIFKKKEEGLDGKETTKHISLHVSSWFKMQKEKIS